MLKDGYIEVFSRNLRAEDSLIILPIFYAGGTVSREISSEDIASGIKAPHVECAGREAVISRIHEWRNFIVLGARDESLTEFAEEIAKRLLHI
jgi:UDP-N-acetylmuramate--alanine ligase